MAYATNTEVKTYLTISAATDDALITLLIGEAQKIIENFTGRVFEASADTTKYFDAIDDVNGRELRFGRDLCAITSVTNGDSDVLTATHYITVPYDAPYYGLKLKASGGKSWAYVTDPENAIAIVGKWAYSTTPPADIKQACIRLTGWLYRQRSTNAEADKPVMTQNGVLIMPSRLPSDVLSIIAPYKRIV